MSQDLRLSRATSAFCRVSPSGTLPGSDITAGEGAGLREKGRAQGSLVQVVWVSYRIRRDWSRIKAWSRSKDCRLSRQNLDEQMRRILRQLLRTDMTSNRLYNTIHLSYTSQKRTLCRGNARLRPCWRASDWPSWEKGLVTTETYYF